jgi:hypothetical protein
MEVCSELDWWKFDQLIGYGEGGREEKVLIEDEVVTHMELRYIDILISGFTRKGYILLVLTLLLLLLPPFPLTTSPLFFIPSTTHFLKYSF